MIAFRDRKGRLWTARLDVAAAVRMRDLGEVDVMGLALGGRPEARKLAEDTERLVNGLFALCLPSCEARGVSDREFGRGLRGRFWGHVIAPAGLAEMVFEGVRDFFEVPSIPISAAKSDRGGKVEPSDLWGNLWHLTSVAGVGHPGPFTFGELIAAADGRQKNEWSRTACVLAMLHNTRAFGRVKAKHPAEFDPTGGLGAGKRNELKINRSTLYSVAALFMGRG